MFKFQETWVLPLESTVKAPSNSPKGGELSKFAVISSPEIASVKMSLACPESGLSVKFAIFVLMVIWSPWRKKRGALGMTINSFWVTVSNWVTALSKVLVCANNCSFHWVKASGVLKLKLTLPASSVCNCGKKKAVSCKFLRI